MRIQLLSDLHLETETFAPGICAGAMPRICRTLSCSAYMPYMPECV